MKTLLATVTVTITVFALPAHGDPIADLSLSPHQVGWYPNTYRGKAFACPDACKYHVGGEAESESAPGVPRRTHVCKVQKGRDSWSYGNQFDDRKACYTTGLDLKGNIETDFFCLCVLPQAVQEGAGVITGLEFSENPKQLPGTVFIYVEGKGVCDKASIFWEGAYNGDYEDLDFGPNGEQKYSINAQPSVPGDKNVEIKPAADAQSCTGYASGIVTLLPIS